MRISLTAVVGRDSLTFVGTPQSSTGAQIDNVKLTRRSALHSGKEDLIHDGDFEKHHGPIQGQIIFYNQSGNWRSDKIWIANGKILNSNWKKGNHVLHIGVESNRYPVTQYFSFDRYFRVSNPKCKPVKPKPNCLEKNKYYTLSFDYAARKDVKLVNTRFSVYWNDKTLRSFRLYHHNKHTYTRRIVVSQGTNKLKFKAFGTTK